MADDSRLSSVVDDNGQLFGLINVIDAAVLLLAILILAAGALLWAPLSAGDETETRYVTIELEPQPAFIAEQIREGDEMSPGGTGGTLTITDIYQYSPEDEINTIVRAEVTGTALGSGNEDADAIRFDGSHMRFGSTINLEMPNYAASGTVVSIDREDSSLDTGTESFVLDMEVDQRTARTIEEGDGLQVGDRDLTVVETVTVYPIPNDADTQRVFVGVTGSVQFEGNTPLLGTQPVRDGLDLTVETQQYELTGIVDRVGSPEESGTPDTRTATVELSDVSPARLDALEAGLTEGTGDLTTAEIIELDDRTLAVELTVRELDDGTVRFRGEQVEIGQEIAFDFGTTTVEGELTALD
ncbi:DUF4330 domain-containing protein [Halobacteria archaeon AArc-m2/3/4]|uniref:DUF4330 domain-containing protein n=1 Tax=Natronoglomus mannanivorans TaxID=2979990 RepID=A0ABT2QJ86_9EURY|nr:DUF4330 domain-containing protein [Halobacteria archaeon AArc-m2/3/4]